MSVAHDLPMLGVAGTFGDAEVGLAQQFDALHQLLYTKGGVRPTNAAIEEVAKLVYLRLWSSRAAAKEAELDGRPIQAMFDGRIAPEAMVGFAKEAFRKANLSPSLAAIDPSGQPQPLWPTDEPFRLANSEVLQTAVQLVEQTVGQAQRVVADPLGTAFDAFLSGRYDHSGGLGTFLTPSSVARAMADIAFGVRDPLERKWSQKNPLIADPYCGTGRFLVAAFETAETAHGESELKALLDHGLAGADQSATATAKTAINLFLYGAVSPHVFTVEDSVTAQSLDQLSGTLGLILTNPPFGGGKYTDPVGIRRTALAIPSLGKQKAIDPALACLVRAIDLLSHDGVLGIVLPDGIVDGRHFDELIDRHDQLSVVANVSLPTSTFALSGTVAKTSAVFLRKSSDSAKRTVLARVEHVGFIRQAGKAASDPHGNELPDVVIGVTKALSLDQAPEPILQVSDEPLVATVSNPALISRDPSRIDPVAMQSRAKVEGAGGVALSTYLSSRRKRSQRSSDPINTFVSVLHVDALGVVSWPDAEVYRPTTPGQLAVAGEVLVSLLNPSKLRAAVVPRDRPEVLCSSEFGVFKPLIDPYAILGLLYDPDVQAQLRPLGRGTSSSRRRIGPEDVLNLVVPHYSDAELTVLGNRIAAAMRQVEEGRSDLFESYGITPSG
ncbi:N-6 DNA methylase [Mycolicibacterium elephantis]